MTLVNINTVVSGSTGLPSDIVHHQHSAVSQTYGVLLVSNDDESNGVCGISPFNIVRAKSNGGPSFRTSDLEVLTCVNYARHKLIHDTVVCSQRQASAGFHHHSQCPQLINLREAPLVYTFGDSLSVVSSSVLPSGKLQKGAHILNYHRVREAQAAGVVRFVHIDGKENPADILTKPRSPRDWHRLMKPLVFWRHANLGSAVNVEESDSRSLLPAPPVLASGTPKQSEKLHLHHVLGEKYLRLCQHCLSESNSFVLPFFHSLWN